LEIIRCRSSLAMRPGGGEIRAGMAHAFPVAISAPDPGGGEDGSAKAGVEFGLASGAPEAARLAETETGLGAVVVLLRAGVLRFELISSCLSFRLHGSTTAARRARANFGHRHGSGRRDRVGPLGQRPATSAQKVEHRPSGR
jgi:hypothetical protein